MGSFIKTFVHCTIVPHYRIKVYLVRMTNETSFLVLKTFKSNQFLFHLIVIGSKNTTSSKFKKIYINQCSKENISHDFKWLDYICFLGYSLVDLFICNNV